MKIFSIFSFLVYTFAFFFNLLSSYFVVILFIFFCTWIKPTLNSKSDHYCLNICVHTRNVRLKSQISRNGVASLPVHRFSSFFFDDLSWINLQIQGELTLSLQIHFYEDLCICRFMYGGWGGLKNHRHLHKEVTAMIRSWGSPLYIWD